jgi:hypothetical protein
MSERRNVVMLRRKVQPDNVETRHAAAFRALEPEVCDLVRSAELASLAEDTGDSGLLTFAIEQFLQMAEGLKKKYYEMALARRHLNT